MLDKHSVKQHVRQLEDRFLELAECTYELLVDRSIDVNCLHARLVSLDVFRRHEHQEFIDKHLMSIDRNMTFNNLWARLGNYWDFLNFDLLEHIINKFGSAGLKHKMKSYKRDLQSFRRSTRLCDFIDCWPVIGQTPPEMELREFVAKVGHQWKNCTLEHLETLKGVITHKFFLPKFTLRLREIMEGSITITWLIPVPFVKSLQEDVQHTSSEFFTEQNIEAVIIDGRECYPSSARKPLDYPLEQYTMGKLLSSHTQLGTRSSKRKQISQMLPVGFEKIQPGTSEEALHRMTLAEEIPSGQSTSMIPSEKIQVHGKQPAYTQLEIEHRELCISESGGTKPRSGPTRSHNVEDQVQYFEGKFHSLKDEACQEVSRNMEPSDFISHVTVLTQHRSFIEEKLSNIQPPVTFENIWSILNLYWDFLNYEFLEHVIERFGSEDLKQQMRHYVEELSSFKQTTQLCDFIKSWLHRDDGPPEHTLKKMVVKMRLKWYLCTLQDMESFKNAVVDKFSLKAYDILFRKAEGEGVYVTWFPLEVYDILQTAELEGRDVCITWLTSSSIATLLQQNMANMETEFFKKHNVDAVTIDGQDVYLSPVKRYSCYLRELYNSERRPVGIGPPTPAEKLLPFKLARIEKKKVSIDEFTKRYLRGDMDDVGVLGTVFYKKTPIKFEEVGKLSSHHQQNLVLIEGAPGVGKTTFSWEFCRKWGKGDILQDHSLLLLLPLRDNNLKEAKTLSDLFHHPNSELQQAVVQEVTSNQGQGVAVWLEAWDELDYDPQGKASVFLDLIHGRVLPLATVFVTSRPWASEHIRENCGHRINQHVEVLTSAKDQIEYYISKAEAESQPSSFAAKFTDYLSSNPVIRAAMYTPIKMAAEVFSWSQHTESPPPTTTTELFTAFTLKTLEDHLSTHPVYHKQQLMVTTFSDLPTDVYKQFQGLCRMAYEGILNRQQLVFSGAYLPTGFASLGLMQEVPQLYTEGRASSYHFIHLTLQEYLAAVYISQLPAHEQTRLFQEHVNSGHFKMTMRFLAGCTKLANIPPDVTRRLMKSAELTYSQLLEAEDISVPTITLHSDEMAGKFLERENAELTYFHFLFEAKDISMTTRTLGSDEMYVTSHYSWTPLDYYVTGHAISHSNCPWRLNFSNYFKDNEKFELFCQGCAAPGGTVCRGHISYAEFSSNDLTSKSMQSFVNIPPHILQNMRELWLYNNKLDGSSCDLLAKVVPSMSRLEKLYLGHNPVGSGGAVEVIKALCGSGVKKLDLGYTGIGVSDCEALCELLKSSNSLNTTLEDLSLAFNTIGEEGVTAIAKMLVENKSMTHLWLFGCHISGHGASELAAALCKNSTLKRLYMQDNPIGVEGAFSMSDMLQHNTSLEELNLCDASVGEEGVHQLINSLKHNQTLRTLYLPKKYKTETSDHRIRWL